MENQFRKDVTGRKDQKYFSDTAEYQHPKNNQSITINRGGVRL